MEIISLKHPSNLIEALQKKQLEYFLLPVKSDLDNWKLNISNH